MRLRAIVTLAVPMLVALVATNAGADCPRSEVVEAVARGDRELSINLDGAIGAYQEALRVQPDDASILWKLAVAYKRKEDWAHVASTLELACARAPDHANYFFLRGYALEQLAQAGRASFADARAAHEKAIALDANYADPEYDLAEILLRQGDEKGALDHYTKAIFKNPAELAFYGSLADLYVRLGFLDHAERTLRAGIGFDKGDGRVFSLQMLLGDVKTRKKDEAGAIAAFEAAKVACGACNERGQQIIFFTLGAAYATAKVPRKGEAISNLVSFQKTVCRGAAAARYADECAESQELLRTLNGPGH